MARDNISPSCAGIGDRDQTARICIDCAHCLRAEDKFIKMPEYALANDIWLGRLPVDLQNGSPREEGRLTTKRFEGILKESR